MKLKELYEDLLADDISCEEANLYITTDENKRIINNILTASNNKQIEHLREEIFYIVKIAQYIYNNSGEFTGLDDSEYDIIYGYMKELNIEDIISAPVKNKNSVQHKYPNMRGSLSKIYYLEDSEERKNPSRKYLSEWIKSIENEYFNKTNKRIDLMNEEVHVFPKFDGVSAIFELNSSGSIERVLTRGDTDTNEAEDITYIFRHIPDRKYVESNLLSVKDGYALKTEIMMKSSMLEEYNTLYRKNYKNTRSIVSALLNSDQIDFQRASMLEIVPLRISDINGNEQLAHETNDYPKLRCLLSHTDRIREFANRVKDVNGLRTDGVVIRFVDEEIHKVLGRENHINKYEVAYKFAEETMTTKVIGVNFTYGLFGRITPVVEVKPVIMKGNTISNISLGSIARFKELDLRYGDDVVISYDIIPYLSLPQDGGFRGSNKVELPTECPICGKELIINDSGNILSCEYSKCPSRIKGKIINFLNKMDISDISEGIINVLYELGLVTSIEDLYKIEDIKKDIMKEIGFGKKSVENMIKSIDSKRTVYDYTLCGSLGINGVGRRTFKSILSKITIMDLFLIAQNKSMSELVAIKGIQEKTADKIIRGINENMDLIEFLQDELEIIETTNMNSEPSIKVYFTQFRDSELKEKIEELGGEVSDSFTKETHILVIPNKDIKSAKVQKAEKYGTLILDKDEMYLLCKHITTNMKLFNDMTSALSNNETIEILLTNIINLKKNNGSDYKFSINDTGFMIAQKK